MEGSEQIANQGALILTGYHFAQPVQRPHESDWLPARNRDLPSRCELPS